MDWRAEPPPGSHQQADVAPYTQLLMLAGTNWVSGMLAAEDGDAVAAVAAVRRQLLLARTMENNFHILPQVLRVKVATGALDLIRATLIQTDPDAGQWALLQQELNRMPGGEALHRSMIAEFKYTTRHFLRMMKGDLALGDSADSAADDSFDLRAVAVERAGRTLRGETPMSAEDTDFMASTAVRWVAKPILNHRMTRFIEDTDALLVWQALPPYLRQQDETIQRLGGPPPDDLLSRIFPDLQMDEKLLSLGDSLSLGDLLDARLVVARTAVALSRARATDGRYPEDLSDLVPVFLDAPPVDTLTGENLDYRLTDEGFVLASRRSELEVEVARHDPWGPTGLLAWSITR
jgi:hypothetical protein